MIEIFITIAVCTLIICVLCMLIIGTIWICKQAIEDIFEDFYNDYLQSVIIKRFINYIKINREKEFPALDRETAKYVYDTINDIFLNDRWKDEK